MYGKLNGSHPSKNARKIKNQKFSKPSKIEEDLTSGKELVPKKFIRKRKNKVKDQVFEDFRPVFEDEYY